MSPGSIWSILGIAPSSDTTTIRRAYARQLRQTNPEDNEEGFKALRQAYEAALRQAVHGPRPSGLSAPEASSDLTPTSSASASGPPQPASETQPPVAADNSQGRAGFDLVDEAAHAALCNRLAQLLSEVAPNSDALQTALSAILSSSAMDSMSVHQRTEAWLSGLLAQTSRRSDDLLDATIRHFGWEAVGALRTTAIAAVLGRRESLLFLNNLKRVDHASHAAFVALMRKPKGRARLSNHMTIGLPRQVAELLELIQRRYPSLLADLDPDALSFWRGYLAEPRLGPVNLWLDLISPPVMALIVIGNWSGPVTWLAYLGCFGVVLASLVAGQITWVHGIARPRNRWRQGQESTAPAWVSLGWAPLALIVLAASATFVPSVSATAFTGLLAATAAAWSYVVGCPDTRYVDGWVLVRPRYLPLIALPFFLAQMFLRPGARMTWRTRAVTSYGFLAIFWITARMSLPSNAWLQMTLPMTGAGLAFVLGAQTLGDAWSRFGVKGGRNTLLIGLGLAVAATPPLLWIAAADPTWSPAAAAWVAVLVFVHKIPAVGLAKRPTLIRDIAMRYGWLPLLVMQSSKIFRQLNGQLLFGGLWLLIGVSIAVAGALRMETLAKAQTRKLVAA